MTNALYGIGGRAFALEGFIVKGISLIKQLADEEKFEGDGEGNPSEGIDTRALTGTLAPVHGSMKGMISARSTGIHELLEKVRVYPGLGRDLVRMPAGNPTCGKKAHLHQIQYLLKKRAKNRGSLFWTAALNIIF